MKPTENNSQPDITETACPKCGRTVPWVDTEIFRPFCSRRCQMIDFGDWAMEKNTIPAQEPPDDWENHEQE